MNYITSTFLALALVSASCARNPTWEEREAVAQENDAKECAALGFATRDKAFCLLQRQEGRANRRATVDAATLGY